MLVRIGLAFREAFVMSIKKSYRCFIVARFVELPQVDAQFSQCWALHNYYNAGAVGQDGKLNIQKCRFASAVGRYARSTQDVFSFGRNAFS